MSDKTTICPRCHQEHFLDCWCPSCGSPIRVAFAGLLRSGKDTCAAHLQERLGAKVLRFAGPMYEVLDFVQQRLGLPRGKDRKFLQWFGTEWGRSIKETLWVDILVREARELHQQGHCIAVPDARFFNEFEALRAEGFKLVVVCRPAAERAAAEGGQLASVEGHASEQDVKTYPHFDAVLVNQGTVPELRRQLDALLAQWGVR